MRAARWILAAAMLATAIAACADSEPDALPELDAGGPDAALDEASVDAGDASEAEAPARMCSADSWCHTPLPVKVILKALWGDSAGILWAVGDRGEILRWDTHAWKVHARLEGTLRAVWGSGPTDIWIGGDRGLFHGTGATSDAVAFARVTAPGDAADPIVSIWGLGPDDVWAVGGRSDTTPHTGRVLHRGAVDAWTLVDIGVRDVAYSHVWGTPKSGVWISGLFYDEPNFESMGVLRRRPAGAAAFADVPMPADPEQAFLGRFGPVRAVSMTDQSITVLGEMTFFAPAVWKSTSTDDGKTFDFNIRTGSFSDPLWRAAFESSPSDTWGAGDYGRVRHWNGTEWVLSSITLDHLPLARPLYAMWRTPSDDLWIVGDNVAMRRDLTPTK